MRFRTGRSFNGEVLITAVISQLDLANHGESSSLFNRFRNHVLVQIGRMIAGYYFKHHREELEAFISSEDFKQQLVDRVAERFTLSIKEKV